MKIIEGLVQGSAEWKAIRSKYPCASEAPVIMGASRHMTRGELLRLKAAGMEKEFSDYVQRMVLDKGHEVEGPARVITERQIGEELYPATALDDAGEYLASLDGVTMIEHILMEHKQWSEELAAAIRAGATEFPDGQEWQMEQQLLVCEAAEKVIFVCSDGTEERRVQMEYRRVPGRAEQLRAGWAQFHADLAAGVAPPAPPKAVAATLDLLPAVSMRMAGTVQVVSNLSELEPLLRAFIERIPAKPSTDQDFATTEASCKALKKLEEELDRSEDATLASLSDVEAMRRMKAMLHKLARDTRLQREKLVEARKLEIRTEEIARGKQALTECIAGHNAAIGKPYMPAIPCDFAAKIKGLRTVQSVRDAIDQHLADCKLAAADVASRIQANMRALRELAAEHAFLFADTAALVLKAPDDCRAVITSRIAEHKAAEERRLEADRARIRQEEESRAREQARKEQEARDAEARRQQEAEAEAQREANAMALQEIQGIQQQVYIATLGRAGVRKGGTIECIRETLAETERWVIDERFGVLQGAAQAAKDKAVAEIRQQLAHAEARAETRRQEAAALEQRQREEEAARAEQQRQQQKCDGNHGGPRCSAAPGQCWHDEAPAAAPAQPAAGPAVIPMPTRAPAPPVGPPTLRLGQINERLGFTVSADFLASLGFPMAGTEKAAKLWHEASFPAICAAIAQHVTTIAHQRRVA